MKRLFVPAALVITAAFLTACGDEPPRPRPRPAPHGPVSEPRPPRPNPGVTVQQPDEDVSDPAPPPPPDATVQEPIKQGDVPYGEKVPGKPGFVTSPFSKASGYVDVRGFPPGTEVKDPYTGKIFLVP